jgi:hypothetical protein
MIVLSAGFAILVATLMISMTLISSQRVQFADAGTGCVQFSQFDRSIIISCDSSFANVVNTINDQNILENLGNQNYLLKANLRIGDGATLSMKSNDVGWLKLADGNGIIVNGRIVIDGVKITSWDTSTNAVISQNMNGTISRGFIQFAASEGGEIRNSEFAYLGYIEPGKRGFDLFGEGPSHDLEIVGSKFHDMWMAFYSKEAYNIKVDGNEYYNNIKYALDPHTGTHDMNVTNNQLYDNTIGVICSDDCYNILVEGNAVHDNSNAGIFFSRNMTDSVARNNHVYATSTGILISESSNNKIYNNTIEGGTDEAVLLFNPPVPDDGVTTKNQVYQNVISNSDEGIRSTLTHDNTLENNTFHNITSNEYLSENSSMIIRGQIFDDTLITEAGTAPGNLVEIFDSGTIHVVQLDEIETQGNNTNDNGNFGDDVGSGDVIIDEVDGEAAENINNINNDNNEEGDSFNTDIEPFTIRLSENQSLSVNS